MDNSVLDSIENVLAARQSRGATVDDLVVYLQGLKEIHKGDAMRNALDILIIAIRREPLAKVSVVCFDVWIDEDAVDDEKIYGEVYKFCRRTRKTTDLETTDGMTTVAAVKSYILKKYPGALCMHCG